MKGTIKYILFSVLLIMGIVSYMEYSNLGGSYYGKWQHYELAEDKPVLLFCGEEVPIYKKEVGRKLAKEIAIRTKRHPATKQMLRRAAFWLPKMDVIMKQYKIPTDLKYIVVAESRLNNVVSRRGAAGFWQIMDKTGVGLGLEINDMVDERYDPIKSTRAACKYLKRAKRELGSWLKVVIAYNMGVEGLKKKLNEKGVDNLFEAKLNKESAYYLYKILAFRELIESPEQYGYYHISPAYQEAYYTVKVDSTIDDLHLYALQKKITYTVLQELNPWLKNHFLTVEDKTYVLKIPKNHQVLFNIDSARVAYESTMDSTYFDTVQVTIDATPDSIRYTKKPDYLLASEISGH